MRSGLGIFLGFGVARGGGGPAPAAPVIDIAGTFDDQPLVGQAVLLTEPDVTGATSTGYQWYEGDPDTADPITGATSASFTPTATEYALTVPIWRRATYTNATGSTVEDLEAPDIVGAVYRNDWSGLVNGDDITDIIAAGFGRRTSGGAQTGIAEALTYATAPAGIAVGMGNSGVTTNNIYMTAEDTFYAANGYTTYGEELYLVDHAAADARFMTRGALVSGATGLTLSNFGPGLSIRIGAWRHQIPGEDPNTGAVGTDIGTPTVAKKYWVRQRIDDTTTYIRYWEYDTVEPATWTNTRALGAPLAWRGPGIGTVSSLYTNKKQCLFWSSGGNAPAPYPVGYVEPVDAISDSMDFAAASSVTSISIADGAMVIALEDV